MLILRWCLLAQLHYNTYGVFPCPVENPFSESSVTRGRNRLVLLSALRLFHHHDPDSIYDGVAMCEILPKSRVLFLDLHMLTALYHPLYMTLIRIVRKGKDNQCTQDSASGLD